MRREEHTSDTDKLIDRGDYMELGNEVKDEVDEKKATRSIPEVATILGVSEKVLIQYAPLVRTPVVFLAPP